MCLSGRDEQGIYPKREREREKERELFNEDNRAQSDSAEIALSVQEQKPGRQPQRVHFFSSSFSSPLVGLPYLGSDWQGADIVSLEI